MKDLFLQLIIFLSISNFSFSQSISGPTCVDELNVSKSYNVSMSGTRYKWYVNGGYFNSGVVEVETTTPNVDVKFQSTGTSLLYCQVYDGNWYIGQSNYFYINVTRKIGNIAGDDYLTHSGTYNYSINPIPGATSYTWTFPSGFSGNSSTNSISLNVSETAVSGYVTVKPNGVTLCNPTKNKYIKISECMGNIGEYDSQKISNRVVSGDFDNDGKEDDIAAFYYYGYLNTTLHIWKGNYPNTDKFNYQGPNGWWSHNNYDANRIVGVVSGDFDRDGFKDDIAAFYDNGNNQMTVHVWRSNGTSFEPMSTLGWFQTTLYDPQKIKGRIVSGDFDRDGFKDDIAAFYDYGNNQMRIHVWQSTGSNFGPMSTVGWFNVTQYDAKKITDRVVSGDFDRDGFEDDIAAFYDYGNISTRIHVWQSTGFSFGPMSTVGWFQDNDYDAKKITGRVVSGDFDNDGFNDDIAAFYDYGNANTRIHVFNSTGNSFIGLTGGRWNSSVYNANRMTGRVVSGNFLTDSPNKSDIVGFYDYGALSTTAHLWNSNQLSQNFFYQGNDGWWKACYPTGTNMDELDHYEENTDQEIKEQLDIEMINSKEIKVYPNPSNGLFYIESDYSLLIDVIDFSGKYIKTQEVHNGMIDLTNLSNGIYFLDIKSTSNHVMSKQKIIITNK